MTHTKNNNPAKLRESVVIFSEWIDAIEDLSDKLRLEILEAAIQYGIYGTVPDNLDPTSQVVLKLIMPNIDRNRKKYEETKEVRRAAGSLGGKAKASNQKAQNVSKPKASVAKAADVAEAETSSKTSSATNGENLEKSDIPDVAENASQLTEGESVVANASYKEKEKGKEKGKEKDKENENSFIVVVDAREKNKKFFETFFSERNQAQIESLCMQLHTTPEELQHLARDVIAEWELTEVKHADYKDQAQHLISQIRIKSNIKKKEVNYATGNNAAKRKNKPSASWGVTRPDVPLRSTI